MAAVKKPHSGQFKPGQSGNPGGRPGGRTVSAVLRERLAARAGVRPIVPGGKTEADVFADVLLKQAKGGSCSHAGLVLERAEGKVPSTIVLEGGAKPVSLVIVRGVSLDDL